MDLEPGMRAAALRVADTPHRYAAEQGWPRDDYRIFMVVHPRWGAISVEFVARAFQKDEPFETYREIMNFLQEDLAEIPELYRATGLSLRPLEGYTFAGDRSWGEETVEVDDLLLNPGVEDLRGPFAPTGGRGQP